MNFDTTVTRRQRLRPTLIQLALATSLFIIVASIFIQARTSSAQDTFNCEDFDSQAEAQAELRSDSSDPSGLDGPVGRGTDGIPGVACESRPGPFDMTPVSGYGDGLSGDNAEEEGTVTEDEGEDAPVVQDAPTQSSPQGATVQQTTPDTGGLPLLPIAAGALFAAGSGLWLLQRRIS